MANFLLGAAALIVVLTSVGLFRVLRGPSDADRMMAVQLLGTFFFFASAVARSSSRQAAAAAAQSGSSGSIKLIGEECVLSSSYLTGCGENFIGRGENGFCERSSSRRLEPARRLWERN